MAGRVAVLSPDGQFGTVDEADAEAVTRAGGRVLTKQEVAAQAAEESYAKVPTWKKVATVATMAGPLGYIPHLALRADGGQLPPEMEAYTQGVSEGMTGGLASVGMKEAVGLVGGQGAAKAYGQTAENAKTGFEGAHMLGEGAGFIGGAVAGGSGAGLGKAGLALPSVGIGAVGNIVEKEAAKRLAGVAAKGVLGRALATGGELAARGMAEGALYAGAGQVSDAMLGDHELAASKVFTAMGMGALGGAVGGAVLGGAGSLAASGARGAAGVVRGAISKAMTKGEQVAGDVAAKAGAVADEAQAAVAKAGTEVETAAARTAEDAAASAKGIAEVTGTKAGQEAGAIDAAIAKASSMAEQKGWAYDQAWKAIGAGNGLQSTAYVKKANKYLPNGTRDVGEVLLRKGIIDVDGGLVNAAMKGTPEHLLPKIEAAREAVGQEIGAMTAASPAMVDGIAIGKAVDNVVNKYAESAATRPLARNLRSYAMELFDSLGLDKRTSVPLQDLLRERRALSNMAFEGAVDAKLAVEVKRELSSELEGLVAKSLDEASGQVPGQMQAAYKALKKDYQALIIASDAAEDSAARMAKGASLGLRDMLAGGGGLTGMASATAHKFVRERGNAAAAVLIHRMAEMGTLTQAIQAVDKAVGSAAKGLLAAPKATKAAETPTEPTRVRADKALKAIAEWQSDPQAFSDKVMRTTDSMQSTTPMLAGSLQQHFTGMLAFLSSKVPVKPDVDPFDPHKAPRLSDADAHTIAQYAWYAERPMRVLEEASRGKITYEGVETLKALPGQKLFLELQTQVRDSMVDLIARGVAPPYRQRERLGMILEFPAVPSQRPEHMQLLQSNVAVPEGQEEPGAKPPTRPMSPKTQPSTLDRLEGR